MCYSVTLQSTAGETAYCNDITNRSHPIGTRIEPGSAEEDDVSLAAAVLRKDRKATAKLVELYGDAIYSYVASRLVPRVEQVDDLTQEVFLAAWRSLASYRGDSPLRSWLLGIARHNVEDYYRDRLREAGPLPEDDAEMAEEPGLHLDDLLDQARLKARISGVMAAMPEQAVLLLRWRYWEKRSAREVGERLGRSEKAVERMLARARAEFRKRWSDA